MIKQNTVLMSLYLLIQKKHKGCEMNFIPVEMISKTIEHQKQSLKIKNQ